MIIKVWPVMLVIGHYTRTYFDSIQSVVQACIGEGGGMDGFITGSCSRGQMAEEGEMDCG